MISAKRKAVFGKEYRFHYHTDFSAPHVQYSDFFAHNNKHSRSNNKMKTSIKEGLWDVETSERSLKIQQFLSVGTNAAYTGARKNYGNSGFQAQ